MPAAGLESDPLEGSSYRSKSLLGRGVMGEVLLAEHRALGKEVVIKVVHAPPDRPELAERMRVEAQILAKLRHPGIVQVNDLGQTSAGQPFIVMERLVGRTLTDEIASRGALALPEAIDIVCELLSALAVAHAAGVVHRAIKPDNVFVHQRAHTARAIKLLDFGVARINVDHRADIYGAGALLYFVLTGQQLFTGPSRIVPIPASIDAIVSKAIANDPDDRFQSAAAMIGALRRAQRERPVAATVSITEDVTIATPLPAPLPAIGSPPIANQEVRSSDVPMFDRFRFALVFCVTMALCGAALIAVLRWVL